MGVELCPVPDGKESADKAIIMDALLFGYDHKPCPDTPLVAKDASTGNGIVLVTGDRGFCALLRELSNRQITTVVIGNGHQKIPPILAQAADFSIQWDEMMETSDYRSSSYGHQNSFSEKVTITEDDHFEFGGWDASSSCNVLLKYESQCKYQDYPCLCRRETIAKHRSYVPPALDPHCACVLEQTTADEQIPSSCEKSKIVEGCQDAEPLEFSPDKGIAGSAFPDREVCTTILYHCLNGAHFLKYVNFTVSFTPPLPSTATFSDQVYLAYTEEERQERYR